MGELTLEALAELVRAALAELGDTPDKVAETLRTAGITGRRLSCSACPVALWLALRVPELRDPAGLLRWEISGVAVVDGDGFGIALPDPVQRFIAMFDVRYWAFRDLEAVES